LAAQAGHAALISRMPYERADLKGIRLPGGRFGLAYSSLVLHYVEDAARFFEEVRRALAPGRRFVFPTERPIYTAPTKPGWSIDARGRRTWPVDGHSVEGPRTTDWLAQGVVKHHRTVGTTLNLLIRSGFAIGHVEEFRPTAGQIAARPELAEELERPMFLLVAARR
jgi:SAM-dependent methyltransferase